MSGRFHPYFLARDYAKCVVAKGKCLLEAPPEEYKPLFTVVDFPSFGFRTMFGSWIVKRVMHPVSTPEFDTLLMFHAPRMGVVNLAEQVALDPALTREIAFELQVDHPAVRKQDIIMSTDLVVTFVRPGGVLQRHAYAVKQAKDLTEMGNSAREKMPRLVQEMKRQTETTEEFTLRRIMVIRQLHRDLPPHRVRERAAVDRRCRNPAILRAMGYVLVGTRWQCPGGAEHPLYGLAVATGPAPDPGAVECAAG